jgi:hypothetical protein
MPFLLNESISGIELWLGKNAPLNAQEGVGEEKSVGSEKNVRFWMRCEGAD